MEIITLETPSLGDRSYVVVAGNTAVVVDPQRDIDRVLDVLDDHDATVTHVLETHVHNDYVTGGYALARHAGADYVMSEADDVSFPRHGVAHGDVLEAGDLRIRVVATPGHTFNHLAYVVESDGQRPALFSGGSLLHGATGRPDLLGDEHTRTLAIAQWGSARRLARDLPAETMLWPTHGFGSFCATTQATGESGTLADEQAINLALTADREAFVEQTLAGLDAWPAYYVHIAPVNRSGPAAPDLSEPATADPDELRRRIDDGEWVVDLRTRTTFAPGHVAGTVNIGLDGSFVTYLGWLAPWQAPVTLLGTKRQVADAVRDMARIGFGHPVGAAIGNDPAAWTSEPPAAFDIADFADLARRRDENAMPQVLDVRRDDERAEAAIPGSQHVPIHEFPDRLDDVDPDVRPWVHCASGYRASIVASLLARNGHDVVLVDDDFERARQLGLAAPG